MSIHIARIDVCYIPYPALTCEKSVVLTLPMSLTSQSGFLPLGAQDCKTLPDPEAKAKTKTNIQALIRSDLMTV